MALFEKRLVHVATRRRLTRSFVNGGASSHQPIEIPKRPKTSSELPPFEANSKRSSSCWFPMLGGVALGSGATYFALKFNEPTDDIQDAIVV